MLRDAGQDPATHLVVVVKGKFAVWPAVAYEEFVGRADA